MAHHLWPGFRLLAIELLVAWEVPASGQVRLNGNIPKDKPPVGTLALLESHPGRSDRQFHFKAAPGHDLFVYFGYTSCPDVCPTTLSDLRHALRELGDAASRVDVAFVTVDPERDVPPVLESYVTSFVRGAHALRPRTQQELATVEHAFGASSSVTRRPDGTVDVRHSAVAYIIDDHGRIVDEWPFGTSSAAMAADLRVLLRPQP